MWIRMMMICFLTNGLGAFGLRIMQGMDHSDFKFPYLMLWYWAGLVLAIIVFLMKKQRLTVSEVAVGAGLGLSSMVGQLGMSYALQYGIPGYIVFQVAPGGGLFLVVLVGIVFFKERVSGYGIAGIILGMTALAVLTFG